MSFVAFGAFPPLTSVLQSSPEAVPTDEVVAWYHCTSEVLNYGVRPADVILRSCGALS
jgi:hypothetical protein